MRYLLLTFLAACSLRVIPSQECSGSPPPGSCSCNNGTWWCSTCSFYEGEGSVACSQPGTSCEIETWEHGCDCTCGSDGWWSCVEETVGSQCPQGAPVDGGVPPDAVLPDAAPCSRIEAENIGDHTGWALVSGSLSGGQGLSALTAELALHFNFTGTTLAVNHELGPTNESIAIYVDDGPLVIIPSQASSFEFVTAPVATGLANTEHHATVVCQGPGCVIDYFDVTCL